MQSPLTSCPEWSFAFLVIVIPVIYLLSFVEYYTNTMPRIVPVFVFSIIIHTAISFNILAIISLPLKSHYMAFRPLFQELALRGHSVTVINNYPEQQPLRNLEYINLNGSSLVNKFSTLEYYESLNSNYKHLSNFYKHLVFQPQGQDCDTLFTNVEVMSRLSRVKYDVIFVEQFMSDCALAIAGALTDTPIIGITSHVLLPWHYSRLGLHFDITSDPFYFTNSGPNPSLYHKVETYLMDFLFNNVGRWSIQSNIQESFSRHLPEFELDIEKIARERMRMMFVYQHFSWTEARPLAPQLLEIGGLHVGKPQPVPEDIKTFLSSAKHGVVYINFGSNLKMSTMSEYKKQQFLEAFKRIRPLKVLMKWENGTINDESILTRNWFPQLDILCHPKVVAFVSHGGMLGTSEAVSCGVPMVTIPFFGDQFGNAANIRSVGLGTTQHLDSLTAESLSEAIKEITSEATQRRAKEISALWSDRPLSVMDSAIYWTEYVARHRNAPPSMPSKNKSLYELMFLDIYCVLGFLLMCSIIILRLILLLLRIMLFSRKNCVTGEKVKEQ